LGADVLYFTRAKALGVVFLCGLGILLSLPNLAPRPAWLPGFVPWNQVELGLDLRGGSYLLLQIDFSAVEKQDLNSLVDQVRQTMRGAALGYTGLHADVPNNQVVLHLLNAGDAPAAMAALNKLITYAPGATSPNIAISQAPDGSVDISIPHQALVDRETQAVAQSITIIQRRIDGSGVLNHPSRARVRTRSWCSSPESPTPSG